MPKRGENIYKRKDGRWEGRYIKGHNDRRKAIYGFVYAKTYKEVKQKLLEKKCELNPIEQNDFFNHFVPIWLAQKKSSLKQSSYSKYVNMLNNHIIPFFGDTRIKNISPDKIDDFVKAKLNIDNLQDSNKKLSIKTIKDIVSLLCNITNMFNESNKISYSFEKWKTTNKESEILSRDEQNILTYFLMKYMNNINLGILISLYTGIRIGELCALKFSNISLKEQTIFIDSTMQRVQQVGSSPHKTQVLITKPKTQKAIREIPIPSFLCDELKKLLPENKNSFLLSGSDTHYVEPRILQYKFKSILKHNNIKDIKFHSLRHTFATRCIEAGCETKCLSEILGHSSVNITLNRYVHSSLEQKKMNMLKMLSITGCTPSK